MPVSARVGEFGIRTASFGSIPLLSDANHVMNSTVKKQDSLFYLCRNTKRRLERLPQLQQYLDLAYASSQMLSEKQSTLISEKQNKGLNGRHDSTASTITDNRSSNMSHLISNSHSNVSLKEDLSLDGTTYATISTSSSPTMADVSPLVGAAMEDSLMTFSMGVLPVSAECDPVTQMSELFQQGTPLCILWNSIKPQSKLPVILSNDPKSCKKIIYDFILKCKEELTLTNEELFTISDIFSPYTTRLIRVLDVVNALMDTAPHIFPSLKEVHTECKTSSEYGGYSKIINELASTERKYVHDLGILSKFKQQIMDSNLVPSQELHLALPNLTDILDFQRRFLVSLEINALADPTKQRLGALFAHSKQFFKLYEPWTVQQNDAIQFLSENLNNLEQQKLIIKNRLELQSFLFKPVQRLCKYPLLLKELLQSCPKDANIEEIEVALEISKAIANNVNENQRKVENKEVVSRLSKRVSGWNIQPPLIGDLLYFDKLTVTTGGIDRKLEVYLFEKALLTFSEPQQKKSAQLSLKKMQMGSSLSLGSVTSSVKSSNDTKLEIRNNIPIIEITSIVPVDNQSLSITWESGHDLEKYSLKFKTQVVRDNWQESLEMSKQLAQNILHIPSINQQALPYSTQTKPVTPKSARDTTAGRRSFVVENKYPKISKNIKTPISNGQILLRISFGPVFYTVFVDFDISINVLLNIIKKRVSHLGTVSKIKYQDEDGDLVMLESHDDWVVAKDMLEENQESILNISAIA